MSHSKKEQERQWNQRKNSQNPHGKVKSFEKLAEEEGLASGKTE